MKIKNDIEIGNNNILKNGVAQSFGTAYKNNGTSLAARANLNFAGINLIKQDTDNTSIYLYRDQPEFLQHSTTNWLNNTSSYTRIMRRGGFWYMAVNKFDSLSSMESNSNYVITIFKSSDLINWTAVVNFNRPDVVFYDQSFSSQVLALSNGDIALITYAYANSPGDTKIYCQYYNGSTTTTSSFVVQSGASNPGRFAAVEGASGKIGIAYLAKGGATAYWQLAFVERSTGINGTFGTPVWIGNNPLRDTVEYLNAFVDSNGYYRVFYKDPSTATSSKVSVAKQSSGGWTVYNTGDTTYVISFIYNDDIYFFSGAYSRIARFIDSSNTFNMEWFYPASGATSPVFIGIYGGYLYYTQFASLNTYMARVFRMNMSTQATGYKLLRTVTTPILNFTGDPIIMQYQAATSMQPLDDGAYIFCKRADGLIYHMEVSSLWP